MNDLKMKNCREIITSFIRSSVSSIYNDFINKIKREIEVFKVTRDSSCKSTTLHGIATSSLQRTLKSIFVFLVDLIEPCADVAVVIVHKQYKSNFYEILSLLAKYKINFARGNFWGCPKKHFPLSSLSIIDCISQK